MSPDALRREADAIVADAISRAARLRDMADELDRPPAEQLRTYEQAASVLECDSSHVSRLVTKGVLPVVEIGDGPRGRRIRQADLDDLIRRRRTSAGLRRSA